MQLLEGQKAVNFNTENNSVLRIPRKMITIFPRRSILRIGMLLRDSEVAKQVRTYLLNVEESSTQQQLSEAMKRDEFRIKRLRKLCT